MSLAQPHGRRGRRPALYIITAKGWVPGVANPSRFQGLKGPLFRSPEQCFSTGFLNRQGPFNPRNLEP